MNYKITKAGTLLEALIQFFPDSSRTTLRDWIHRERVQVDGQAIKIANTQVVEGQTLTVGPKGKREGDLPIVYEDEHLVVIDKPSGLLSVATDFQSEMTAHAILKQRYSPEKVYVIHRLDQETSGLMMFARTEEAYTFLKEELKRHDVERIYYGLVEGVVKGEGTWESYLKEDAAYKVHASSNPSFGERAVTHYRAIASHTLYSLVRFQLETGKKNQIRVQSAAAGHPLAGDKKYGATLDPLKRVCLHAHELHFIHPVTKKKLAFSSKIPKEFLVLLQLPRLPADCAK